uniref:Cyclin C-terminal domain-containing protein n=1 Tax=Branchiostoma floridae TaxID=7739 RepID=C3YYZ3_BRAFL|eukprot:XP_002598489.1 hypothetical protein BRAFLDRAFT_66866 [Branchiostoma floridae]
MESNTSAYVREPWLHVQGILAAALKTTVFEQGQQHSTESSILYWCPVTSFVRNRRGLTAVDWVVAVFQDVTVGVEAEEKDAWKGKEEVHPLCAEEIVSLCDEGQYTRGQLRMLERKVLSTLGFHLTVPTSILFLEHLAEAGRYDHLTSCLARHLLVTSLQDYVICQHAPSSLALAALNLAASLVNNTRD